jgi:hypothetical protein
MALIRLESLKGETIYLETQTINSIINCGGRDGIGAFIFFEDGDCLANGQKTTVS